MTSTPNLVTGTVGEMIHQLARDVGMDAADPTLFAELSALVDSQPQVTALSENDRRASAGAIITDLAYGDTNNEEVPGGPHVIRRRAEWVTSEVGAKPLDDPSAVSAALHAVADAMDLSDLVRSAQR